MKLVTIKNKYMYKPATPEEKKKYKPNGVHLYAAYTDEETKELRLVQMTHVIEEQKAAKIKRGKLLMVKLPNVDMPSGVKNEYFSKDVDGNAIDLAKVKAQNIKSKSGKATYVRKPMADKIKAFAKKRHK